MLINVPVSIYFKSDVAFAFNLFFILYHFCLFIALTKMQPPEGVNTNETIIERWGRRNKGKLQMLNLVKKERINYEFEDVRKAIRGQRTKGIDNRIQ